VIYSNNIAFYVLKTDEAAPFVQVEKISNGRSSSEARKRAEKIKYNFEFQGNTLILDNYLLTDLNNKFRNQKVEIYLYLPEGTLFQCDESVREYDDTDNAFFDLWWDRADHMYVMEENSVKCVDCDEDHDEPEWEGETPPAPPAADINVSGNGRLHLSDVDLDIHVNVDSVCINS
jgi:hypothetical protein